MSPCGRAHYIASRRSLPRSTPRPRRAPPRLQRRLGDAGADRDRPGDRRGDGRVRALPLPALLRRRIPLAAGPIGHAAAAGEGATRRRRFRAIRQSIEEENMTETNWVDEEYRASDL